MKNTYSLLLIVSIVAIFSLSCKKEKEDTTENTPPPTNEVVPQQIDTLTTLIRPQIEQKLKQYFIDVSAEKIDENQYFAPILTEFFSSKNQPIAKVGESLRQGFAKVESRTITLNPEMNITPIPEGYEVIFSGVANAIDNQKKQSSTPFHNRVVFNREMKITSYTQATASRSVGEATEQSIAQEMIRSSKSAAALNAWIHPEIGVTVVFRPGAIDNIYTYTRAEKMEKETSQAFKQLQELSCKQFALEELPKFDCDKAFSKKGCFIAPVSGYSKVSAMAKSLSTLVDPIQTFRQKEITQFQTMEKNITHLLLSTEDHLMLGFGQIDGKWYLLLIDAAQYDCSA